MSSDEQSKTDFGAKLKELESITEWFESDQVDLNTALGKFERGMKLADELKKELQDVENRVEKIKARFDGPATGTSEPSEAPGSGQDSDPSLF